MKKTALLSITICLCGFLKAQQMPLDNQYLINNFALSPAYAGSNGNVESFLMYRRNWVGVKGGPETKMFNINGPVKDNMGLGGTINVDEVGIFNTFSAMLSYSYLLKFNEDNFLRFGASAGAFENHINVSGIKSIGSDDPIVMANQSANKTLFDANFGIAYHFRNLDGGMVVPHLLESSISGNSTDLYTLKRQYLFHLSYHYDINKDWQVTPFTLLRKTANSNMFYEFAALVKYQKQLWLGTTYRKGNTIAMTLGGLLHSNIAFNYSYEFGQGMLGYASGNHEISIGFMIGKNKCALSSVFSNEIYSKKKPYLQW